MKSVQRLEGYEKATRELRESYEKATGMPSEGYGKVNVSYENVTDVTSSNWRTIKE